MAAMTSNKFNMSACGKTLDHMNVFNMFKTTQKTCEKHVKNMFHTKMWMFLRVCV